MEKEKSRLRAEYSLQEHRVQQILNSWYPVDTDKVKYSVTLFKSTTPPELKEEFKRTNTSQLDQLISAGETMEIRPLILYMTEISQRTVSPMSELSMIIKAEINSAKKAELNGEYHATEESLNNVQHLLEAYQDLRNARKQLRRFR